MSEERWTIPASWRWATAGDIAKIVGGGTPSSKVDGNFAENGIPWITPADLTGYRESHISRGRRDLSEQGFAGSGAQLIPAGSVLFSSRAPIGYCVIASNEVSTNQGFKSLVLDGKIDPGYIRHYLLSAKEYAESKASGTTFMELSGARVAELAVPIAPLPEQRRIVAKVDGFTARTARARKELDRVPILIARYKQRLLALAFSGELTAGWRKANPSLQTALKKVRGNRKADTRLARRKPSASVPEYDIPKTWDWISPDEVAADAKYSIGIGPFGSNLVRTDYRESGVRLVFVRDIRREKFEESDARYIEESKATELHQHIASPGDVLITKMGDPPGDSALFPMDAEPAVITADCIKLTPHGQLATAKFLNFAIRSEIVQSQFKAITAGVAQQKVSLDRFRQLALPIAPLEEQAEIVRRIESAFDWLDRVAADHAAATRLLPKLDAAILAKAFCGELVPQDPNDEPAAKLLERIRRQREAAPKAKRGRKRSSTTIAGSAEGVIEMTGSATAIVGPRKARKSSMAKSRRDDDVWQQPYLAGKLRELRSTDVQALFLVADLPVADFYKQLAWEIDKGLIIDSADELKAA